MARVGGKQNGARRFVGGGPRPDLRVLRQKEAQERQAERDGLTPKEQLKHLDQLLGAGVGAVKERARLVWQVKTGRKTPASEKEQARLIAAEKEQAEQARQAEQQARFAASSARLAARPAALAPAPTPAPALAGQEATGPVPPKAG